MTIDSEKDFHVTSIVTTYNRPEDTAVAIQSALDQSHNDHDVVVVDDGSKDHTREFLSERFGQRISYHYKENGGVSSARNFGVSKAQGPFIAFLDSDDRWVPAKLEQQIERFRRRPELAMVLSGYHRVDRESAILRSSDRREHFPREGAIFDQVVKHPYLVPSTVMMRQEAFEAVGQFDEGLRTAEDIDLFMRVALDHQIGFCYEPLTFCLEHEDEGLSILVQTYYDHVRATEDFVRRNSARFSEASKNAALFHAYSVCALGLLWKRDYKGALLFASKAVRFINSLESALFIKTFNVRLAKSLVVDAKRLVFSRG